MTAQPGDLNPDRAEAATQTGRQFQFTGVVALDGPSGTGKSTVARRLARRLGARYLDTGAMYRAATLAVLEAGVPVSDADRITAVVGAARIDVTTDPVRLETMLDRRHVEAEIRSPEVTAAVSAVSAVAAVRALLVEQQRLLIGDGRIVVEGRDIGSVVWPAARPKVFLTASAMARAQRRARELGPNADVAAVDADLRRRDLLDSSRSASPLGRADDAIEIDTTDLGIDEVVDQLVDIVLRGQSADA